MKNKIFDLVVCIILIGTCLVVTPITVSADQDGDYIYTIINSEATITKYTGAGGKITIPSTLGGYKTVAIGYQAFYYCTSLISVAIPNNVTTIGYQAFYSCTSLSSIILPNSITTIGDNAFSYCSSLSSINLGYNLTTIGDNAFAYCISLATINIGNNVSSIGDSAFTYCSSLTSITIPDSVITIGNSVFAYCSSLTNVTLGNNITYIKETAFAYCSILNNVTIGDSVTTIGNSAFAYCSSLFSIIIPNNVTKIGDNAFYYCTSLTSVTIGNNVTVIKKGVFYLCASLTSITFLGLVAPVNVESDWIFGTPEKIRGHAYTTSNFPIPGSIWNGLTMGESLSRGLVDENDLPMVDFTWKPSNPKPNQEVIFDASWSYDPDGSIILYEWDWNNDGIYDESHTTLIVIHKWTKAGNYPVQLRVTDNSSTTSNKTINVAVGNGAGTPGFDFIFVLCAFMMFIFLWKKKVNI